MVARSLVCPASTDCHENLGVAKESKAHYQLMRSFCNIVPVVNLSALGTGRETKKHVLNLKFFWHRFPE
jgi:hypothetical protein